MNLLVVDLTRNNYIEIGSFVSSVFVFLDVLGIKILNCISITESRLPNHMFSEGSIKNTFYSIMILVSTNILSLSF